MKAYFFFVLFKLIATQLPSEGKFVFMEYIDSQCAISSSNKAKVYQVLEEPPCWSLSGKSSILLTQWTALANSLIVSFYPNNSTCSGNESVSGPITCNGACLQNVLKNETEYYTCVYINIPETFSFFFSWFTDSLCKDPDILETSMYNASNLCLVTSSTSSILPLSWNSDKMQLSYSPFQVSGNCTGGTVQILPHKEALCNGACMHNAINRSQYYTCSYLSSSPLGMRRLMILLIILSLI